jgi:hypothetical protein
MQCYREEKDTVSKLLSNLVYTINSDKDDIFEEILNRLACKDFSFDEYKLFIKIRNTCIKFGKKNYFERIHFFIYFKFNICVKCKKSIDICYCLMERSAIQDKTVFTPYDIDISNP